MEFLCLCLEYHCSAVSAAPAAFIVSQSPKVDKRSLPFVAKSGQHTRGATGSLAELYYRVRQLLKLHQILTCTRKSAFPSIIALSLLHQSQQSLCSATRNMLHSGLSGNGLRSCRGMWWQTVQCQLLDTVMVKAGPSGAGAASCSSSREFLQAMSSEPLVLV